MSIQGEVNELNLITQELKDLNARARALRQRKKVIEATILAYLESKDQPGIKYHGQAIVIQEKEKRANKKPKERDEDAIAVLRGKGFTFADAETILKDMMEARKGPPVQNKNIKVQSLRKK